MGKGDARFSPAGTDLSSYHKARPDCKVPVSSGNTGGSRLRGNHLMYTLDRDRLPRAIVKVSPLPVTIRRRVR